MTALIEVRETIRNTYAKYDTYMVSAWKFILAFLSFLMLNGKMGYFEQLNHVFLSLIIALCCSILPVNGIILFGSMLALAHLYGASVSALIVGGGILIILLLLYFSVVPRKGYVLVITMLALSFGMPCVVPLVFGLISGPLSVAAIGFGTVAYYTFDVVTRNAGQATAVQSEVVTIQSQAIMEQVQQMIGNVLKEERLVLTLISMIAVFLVVYLIRRMVVHNAWSLAIGAGTLTFFIVDVVGSLMLGITDGLIWLMVGTLISVGIAFCVKFLLFQVDYSKSMQVEFEDDEYVYYVRAVPKLKKGCEKSGEY